MTCLPFAVPRLSACRCPALRISDGWCIRCRAGYVAGVRIKSALLFEVLDAHGHDIDIEATKCEKCRKACETDGFCDGCRRGFVRRQAYLSRLTYHLAKGERTDPTNIACDECRKNADGAGWCDRCRVGMIGPVAIRDPSDFTQARAAYGLLLAAVGMAERCEFCAAAMITDTFCPECKTTFRDGKPVSP